MARRMSRSRGASVGLVVFVLLSGMVAPLVGPNRVTVAQEDPTGPVAQQLIAAAVDSGQLDYDTSLVYRAYALFGDERLPDEFVGAGAFEDSTLFSEAWLNWDRLSEQTRDQLTPFLVRPTDARSIFAAKPTSESSESSQESGAKERTTCVDDWATATHPTYPLKVWMRCTGDFEGDLAQVLSIVDEFWQPEVDLMGPPKEDAGGPDAGGDTGIDLYVVDLQNEVLPRNGDTDSPLSDSVAAMAIADYPIEGNTASGYMIARRSSIGDEFLHLTLAHEFFHVLQYAHNVTVTWGFSGTPYGEFEILHFTPYWFFEATPTWVESYLYRDKVATETMNGSVHAYFIDAFHTDEPLYTSVERDSPMALQIYAAYIWFYFVEQEVGPEAIAQIWRNLESVKQDDFEGTLAAIDAVLPFAAHFRDFAVRNLNLDLEPGDPITPSYWDMDSSFPEGVRPPLAVGEGRDRVLKAQAPGDQARKVVDTIKPLSAHYYHFIPTDEVDGVTLDFAGMDPAETLDVDLIVKIKDSGWERRQLAVDETTTLCRANPDDDVEAFYLVLSNHSMDTDGALGGSFTLDTSGEACA